MADLEPIPLNQIPFQVGVLLFSVSLIWVIASQISYYPRIGRFAALYSRDPSSKRFLNLRIVIFCWGAILLATGFSIWSLYRFTQLINFLFKDGLSFEDKVVSVSLPLIYLLIPQYIARLSTTLALITAPEDYHQSRQEEPESFARGVSQDIYKAFGQEPRFTGHLIAIDTGLTLLILFFTPSMIKRAYEFSTGSLLLLLLFLALLILLGVFALGIRLDGSRFRDIAISLGKLAVVVIFLTLISTLREIDLVEIGFFALLGIWISLASVFGAAGKNNEETLR